MKSAAAYIAVAVAVAILAAEVVYTAGYNFGRFAHWFNDKLSGIVSGRIAWRPIVSAAVEWAHKTIETAPAAAAQSPTIQRCAAVPVPVPARPVIQRPPLDSLTVRQLRTLAREAGFSALARSGRRADLLAALS